MSDFKFASRQLLKNPGFATVAIITLALGIGANTAIFQLLNAVRLKALPVANPAELVEIRFEGGPSGIGISDGPNSEMTYPLWEQFQKHHEGLAGVFAWGNAWGNSELPIGEGVETRMAKTLFASGDFFNVLGVSPMMGRLLNKDDDRRGAGPAAVVISYAFWQSEFGGRDSILGQSITLGDRTFQIVGVTPPSFFGIEVGRNFDVALPLTTRALWVDNILNRTDAWWLRIMGRLKPGVTREQVAGYLSTIAPGILEATAPDGYGSEAVTFYRKLRVSAFPAGTGVSQLRSDYNRSLWLMLGITGLVLVIACVNLANLTLARAGSRAREIAVRLALGGSRSRLMKQLLAESLLLSVIGAVAGAGLAQIMSRTIAWFLSTQGNRLNIALDTDWRVLTFASTMGILACVLFGLTPAIRCTRVHPAMALSARGPSQGGGRERFAFQRLLTVLQVSFSLVLLSVACLLVRSFRELITLNPGFRQDGILVVWSSFARPPKDRHEILKEELLKRTRALPQVESAAFTSQVPLYGSSWTMGVHVTGLKETREGRSKITWASPDYFRTMQIGMLSGRDFNELDRRDSPKVMLVNETFARRFLGTENPIGARVRTDAEPNYPEAVFEVIGLVKDTKYGNLRQEIPPIAYAPATQHPFPGPYASMVVRFSGAIFPVIAAIKQQVTELDPTIRMETGVLRKDVLESLARERLMAWLSGLFGALAVALVIVGLYGLISYIVLIRRNELGIRLALGGQPSDVLWLVLRQGFQMTAAGICLGLVVAFVVSRLMQGLLYGVAPNDSSTLALASLMLLAVAILASWLPARAAAKLDPMDALRYE
jgi:predicted permease